MFAAASTCFTCKCGAGWCKAVRKVTRCSSRLASSLDSDLWGHLVLVKTQHGRIRIEETKVLKHHETLSGSSKSIEVEHDPFVDEPISASMLFGGRLYPPTPLLCLCCASASSANAALLTFFLPRRPCSVSSSVHSCHGRWSHSVLHSLVFTTPKDHIRISTRSIPKCLHLNLVGKIIQRISMGEVHLILSSI